MTVAGAPLRIAVMGVAGAGKTTIGRALALTLGVTFIDADDLHPSSNVSKMSGGVPLEDDDRWPWLDEVGRAVAAPPEGVVVACSALKRRYRNLLRAHVPTLQFVHLAPSRAALQARLHARSAHFMPPSLLESQLDALEPLEADEPGVTVETTESVDGLVSAIVARLADDRQTRTE